MVYLSLETILLCVGRRRRTTDLPSRAVSSGLILQSDLLALPPVTQLPPYFPPDVITSGPPLSSSCSSQESPTPYPAREALHEGELPCHLITHAYNKPLTNLHSLPQPWSTAQPTPQSCDLRGSGGEP